METRNRLLMMLAPDERAKLLSIAPLRSFERGDVIRRSDDTVRRLVFPETMLASLVVTLSDGRTAEVAAIGCDGLVGFQTFLDGGRMPSATVCAVPGTGHVIAAEAFRRVVGRGRIRHAVGAFAQGLINELAQVAACNRLHDVEQRTARWLLFTQDRVGRDQFQITQEYLAAMIGASRTAVAVVAGRFASDDIAYFRHGTFRVEDRAKLERAACECYAIVRGEFARLVSWEPSATTT